MATKKPKPKRTANSAKTARGRPFSKGNQHAFKPGQSGSPSGRPRDTITPHLREIVRKKYPGKSEWTYGELIAEALVSRAIRGDVRAIAECFDRLEGKPKQSIDLTVEERQRELAERAIEMLMTDAGVDRDAAIEALAKLTPEVKQWIN